MSKNFIEEFDKFKKMLEDRKPFAFSRFSDGEIFILQNKKLILGENFYVTGDIAGSNIYGPEERKEFNPNIHQTYRLELLMAFQHKQDGYFKGIPSKKDIHVTLEGLNFEDESDLTFANLFINFNYKRYIEEIVLKIFPTYDTIYVVNERADLNGLPFKVSKVLRIGENCMINDYDKIETLKELVSKSNDNTLILLSAASLSNLMIFQTFQMFPNCTFLDIGSSLNPYLGDKMQSCLYTRDYLREYWLKEKTYYGSQIDEWQESRRH